MGIKKEFFESWKNSVISVIDEKYSNYQKVMDMSDEEKILNYISYIRKCANHPFTVYESIQIKEMIPDNAREAYNEIKGRLIEGKGVEPYLSSQARKLRPDGLFNDWNILHLHLGEIHGANATANRTRETLHLQLTNDSAYLIKIGAHGSGAYNDPEDLNIVKQNWPDLLASMPNVNVEEHMDSQLFEYRQNGIMTIPVATNHSGDKEAVLTNSLGYSTKNTSNRDLEILDRHIMPLLNSILETASTKMDNPDLLKKGDFHYYPENELFTYGFEEKGKFIALLEVNSKDFFEHAIYTCQDNLEFKI